MRSETKETICIAITFLAIIISAFMIGWWMLIILVPIIKHVGLKEAAKKLHLDYMVLAQLVFFMLFFFFSRSPFKSVILYFSFMIFFSYWLIKIVFSKEIIDERKDINKKL